MICVNCGMDNEPGEAFCVECGSNLKTASSNKPNIAPPQPVTRPEPVVLPELEDILEDDIIAPVITSPAPTPPASPEPVALPETEDIFEDDMIPPVITRPAPTSPPPIPPTTPEPEPEPEPAIIAEAEPEPETITPVIENPPPVPEPVDFDLPEFEDLLEDDMMAPVIASPPPIAPTSPSPAPAPESITYVPEPNHEPLPPPETMARLVDRPAPREDYEPIEPIRAGNYAPSSSFNTKKLLIIAAIAVWVVIAAAVAAIGARSGWFSGGDEDTYVAEEMPEPPLAEAAPEEVEEAIEEAEEEAEEEVVEEGDGYTEESLFLIAESENGVEITGFLGAMEVVLIPPTIAGKPIVGIGKNAFDSIETLAEIAIPDTVTIIDDEAFADCVNLAAITLPAELKWIGEFAFWNCRALRTVTIPAGVEYIGEFAFASCTALDIVNMLGEVTLIGEFAFLKDYIFPDSNTRLLDMDDVQDMSEIMVQLGRQEILARYGYAFNNEDTQSYFDMWGWYQALEKKPRNQFTLTEVEDANREFLGQYPWLANEAAMSIAWVMDTGGGANAAFNSAAVAAGGIVAAGFMGANTFIVLFDYDGNAVWNNSIVINGYFSSVAAAADGFVAVGETEGKPLIVKFDYNGNITWTGDYGADDNAGGDRFVAVAASDGIVVVGNTNESALIQKFDNSGATVWRMGYGGADDKFTAVTALADGVLASGTSGENALLARYDNSGNVVWAKTFGGDGTDIFDSAVPVSDGIVVVGHSSANSFGNGDLAGLSAKGGADATVVKYDYNGNVVWRRNFGGSGRDEYFAVTVVADGFVAVGSSGSDSFGGGDWADYRGLGGFDTIIVRYDNSGEVLWQENSGSPKLDRLHSAMAVLGGIVAVGRTGEYDGDGQWQGDALIVKYDFDN